MKGHKLLYGAAVLMVIGFGIDLAVSWWKYNTTLNSAPFWMWALCDAMLWLVPAMLAFAAGWVAHKKLKNKEKRK